MLADDVIDKEFCGSREDQTGDAIDHHKEESQGE
jgi:hypothetical protein